MPLRKWGLISFFKYAQISGNKALSSVLKFSYLFQLIKFTSQKSICQFIIEIYPSDKAINLEIKWNYNNTDFKYNKSSENADFCVSFKAESN